MSTTTYRHTGDIIDYTPGSNVSAGDIIVQNELCGQVVADTLSGEKGALRVTGVINIPKLSTDVVAVGDAIYWDAGNTRGTKTASTHKMIGKAVEAAGNGVTDVDILLTPQMLTP